MRTLCFFGVSSLFLLCAPSGCGDPFTAGTGGAGGSPATTTTTGTGMGGDGGGATTTTTGAGGQGGQGGQGGCDACGAGEFCNAAQECKPCSDLSQEVNFGLPVPVPLNGPGTEQSFPRVRREGAGERLVYMARITDTNTDIATATGMFNGGMTLGSSVINSDGPESGPLYAPEDVDLQIGGITGPGALLFDGVEVAQNLARKVYAVESLNPLARVPFAEVNINLESYSVAVAFDTSPIRYWFMNTRLNPVAITGLVTKRKGDGATFAAINLSVPSQDGSVICPVTDRELAPWVTPKGDYLFFQTHRTLSNDCDAEGIVRSFYVQLGSNGLPEPGHMPVEIIPNMIQPNMMVGTPSLSPDMCRLYFTSDIGDEIRVLSAPRM